MSNEPARRPRTAADTNDDIAQLNGWAQAIAVSWRGLKEVLLIMLPVISIYMMYITKSQVNDVKDIGTSVEKKTDVAAIAAVAAAEKTEVVKNSLDQSTAERDKQLEIIHKAGLETNATLNRWKAATTKDPSDLIEAKAAELLLESHKKKE